MTVESERRATQVDRVARWPSSTAGFVGYRCSTCGESYSADEVLYICPKDGGNLDILLDYRAIGRSASARSLAASRDPSMWRYEPLLPVADPGLRGTALRAVGWTPLLKAGRLGAELGLKELWLKDDGRNPTASFKDRASALVVARAREIGAETVVTASTGNAGAALAGMAAAAGLPAVILAPRSAPPAKVAQLLIFGARVMLVEGSYDQAFDLTLEASAEFGWYCRNTGYNPFTAEGKKTAAFEICEQLTASVESGSPGGTPAGGAGERAGAIWEVPDSVIVSVGDGNILSGLHKGFKDLLELGWIERLPRLFGVQSTGSAAVANAFRAGSAVIEPVAANTIADSIAVDLPRDGLRALRAVRETAGAILAVEDAEILAAIRELGREAVFAEPAAAASYAGLVRAAREGRVGRADRVVVVVTGSGLKDVSAAMEAAGEATVIEPTLGALKRALG
jgi:threonine synthase